MLPRSTHHNWTNALLIFGLMFTLLPCRLLAQDVGHGNGIADGSDVGKTLNSPITSVLPEEDSPRLHPLQPLRLGKTESSPSLEFTRKPKHL